MRFLPLFFLCAVLTVSCGGEPEEPEAPPADALEGFGAALCRAASIAPDDPREAEAIFTDELHAPLHQLAGDIGDVSTSLAADLLEAKQAVEAAEGTPQIELPVLWADLVDASAAALERLDVARPPCAE